MSISTCNCLGYNVFSDSLDMLPQFQKAVINTINQYSYCIAEKDNDFKDALKSSDILLPDGIGIVAAAKFLNGSVIKKISGADLHHQLLSTLNKNAGSCFYLGSSTDTLKKIEKRLKKEFPNVKVHFYSPPFKKEFTYDESRAMIDKVNEVNPDVLFIGMTAPKQEKWAINYKDQLNTTYICSIGAVFDFYAGTIKRPGKIWINMGLEWMGRMVMEPKRLYKRYLFYGPVFVYKLVQEKLKTEHGPVKKNGNGAPVITIHPLRSDIHYIS